MRRRGKWKVAGFSLFCVLIILSNVKRCAANDKLKHFGVSTIFGAAGESVLHYKTDYGASKRIILGTTLGTVPGFVKELIDSNEEGNYFSGADLAADIAGAFFGAVVGNFINNAIQVRMSVSKEKRLFIISLSYEF